ncbi:MAG: hypothetical protein HUJ72_02115, partial [Blautia sp.]|nr:hypothetical protein [Blautia sp.]
DSQIRKLNYQLKNIKNGKYKVKTYSVNHENGSVQEEKYRLSTASNLSLTRMEIDYLKRICTPHIQIRECIVERNVLNFETVVLPQEIQYIHISYMYE